MAREILLSSNSSQSQQTSGLLGKLLCGHTQGFANQLPSDSEVQCNSESSAVATSGAVRSDIHCPEASEHSCSWLQLELMEMVDSVGLVISNG